ncbi:acyltransferase [Bradyrhizobium barranii subsp. barranii]|uniref:Acyltransferase n=1 Tax=Bradyrhizobium barranii subsp. barranii TaxID=2823807 RepID=A0A939MB06_9BRAD|nr:acyltransferase [Bradyrhizobium barranii]UEM08247.1 acyltransferase [Bradyrhizobium barranii subsp. barranii]
MSIKTSHISALDGIRGIALLMVFAAHSHPQLLRSGFIGVDLFFVLSGFLITSILLNEHLATGRINVARFYMRRALRLLPALFIMVGCVTAYVAVYAPPELAMTLENARSIVFYYWNWTLAFNYGATGWTYQWVFGHLWSLSVEEQFYLLWPFVLTLALPFRRLFLVLLLVGIAAPPIARLLVYDQARIFNLYFRTDLHFDGLMWGALGAWIVANGWTPSGRTSAIVGPAALAGFMAAASLEFFHSGAAFRWAWVPLDCLAMLAIVCTVVRPPAILETAPLRWTGKISYGLYLWHLPIFHWFGDTPLATLEAVGATYAIAALSFYGIERHFLRLKNAFAAKTFEHARH